MFEWASPIAIGGLGLWVFAHKLRDARRETEMSVYRMSRDAEMLSLHAASISKFLSSPKAPVAVKQLLLEASDAFCDQGIAEGVAEWASSHAPESRDGLSDDALAKFAALDNMRVSDPDLYDLFASTMISVVVAAMLRWPAAGGLLERIPSASLADPRLNVSMAVAATGFRAGWGTSIGRPSRDFAHA